MDARVIRSQWERVVILIAGICILAGGVVYLYGEWAVGVGTQGVINKLIQSIGMGALGLGLLAIGVIFARSLVRGFATKTSADRREAMRQLASQGGAALLNLVVYGGLFILAMGGVAALDSGQAVTLIVALIVWALCVIVFIAYRRFRKAHQTGYGVIGMVGMTLFLFALGGGMTLLFVDNARAAALDLADGPRAAEVFLVDATTDRPHWRYRFAAQTDHVLTFYTPDEERIVLEVPESDIAEAKVINDYGNFVHLIYYPNTQVFCEAEPWTFGRQAMGADLLDRLHETYDFDL